MAQWNGQFTGNTHATKIEDLEAMLRHAVAVFRETNSDTEQRVKGKAVQKLAAKLLSARLKFLKAQLYDVQPVVGEDLRKRESRVESLMRTQEKVYSDGVNGILFEFNAQDLTLQS